MSQKWCGKWVILVGSTNVSGAMNVRVGGVVEGRRDS